MSDFDDALQMADEAFFLEAPTQVIYNGVPLVAVSSASGMIGNTLGPGGFAKTNTQKISLLRADVIANNITVGQRITIEGDLFRINSLNPIGSTVTLECGPLGDTGKGGAF